MKLWPLFVVAACSGPSDKPTIPAPPVARDAAIAAVDAPEANQEEKLAAIQKAMNELDEVAQTCWAIAATDRLDIEGDVEMLIDISPATAKTQVIRDTTKNSKLLGCLAEVLGRYKWAPPLHGQAIQLPFKFRAPNAQYTIDRSHVAWNGQGKVSVAVLVDENNTANTTAAMVEVALQTGGSTGMRITDRPELWYFLGAATVQIGKKKTPVSAGDMLWVPAQSARDIQATSADVHAMIAFVPGGREGTARAGALPTREVGVQVPTGVPIFLPAAKAKTYGGVTIYAEPSTIKVPVLAASVVKLPAGTTIPEHVHQKETELLYVLSGSGTMTVAGVKLAVTPTTVVQIPMNTKHSFVAAEEVLAVQLYTPAGPEQRFKVPK